jgi:tetratricopeptide (TPR) repeat protein
MFEKLRQWLAKNHAQTAPESAPSNETSNDPQIDELIEEGRILYDSERFREGVQVLARAVAAAPRSVLAHKLYASCLMRAGRAGEAASAAARAHHLNDLADESVLQLLGAAHAETGNMKEAQITFEELVKYFPENPQNWVNLEVASQNLGDWNRVRTAFDCEMQAHIAQGASPSRQLARRMMITRSLRDGNNPVDLAEQVVALQDPITDMDALEMAASVYYNAGHAKTSRAIYEKILAADPTRALSKLALGFHLLSDGDDVERAWQLMDARYELRGPEYHTPALKLSPGRSKVLHVYSEQGLGDIVMFGRFLPHLKARADKLVFHLPKQLTALFAGEPSVDQFVEHTGKPDMASFKDDDWIPLLEAPLALGLGLADYKFTAPFLHVPAERIEQWKYWLEPLGDAPRIGLVWAGNRKREDDDFRSVPPAFFEPLADIPEIQWVRLQMDALPQYIETPFPFPLHDPTEHIRDMADTAAIITQLDLVISIDTSVAHLAAALDVPCWLLLPRMRDWRWNIGSDEHPWYRSTRQFRVAGDKQWSELIERIKQALLQWRVEGATREAALDQPQKGAADA